MFWWFGILHYICVMNMEQVKRQRLKTVQSHVVDIVDEYGEVKKSQTSYIRYLAGAKDEFFLAYSHFIIRLKESTDLKVALFAALCERHANGRSFAYTGAIRDEIGNEIGCSPRSLDRVFKYLVDEELIIKVARGVFRINPRYIFKGSSKEREGHYKAVLEMYYEEK